MAKTINSYTVGKDAENKALLYLQQLGWQIIAHNFRCPYGEVDILATKENLLVAFEVKTRKNVSLLFYAISEKQKSRIANALLHFLSLNLSLYNNFMIRFDALLISSINAKITHIENAWSVE